MLVKKTKQAEELSNEKFLQELKASSEVKVLMDLERKISRIDNSLHCELEAISGHHSGATLSVFPSKAKNYREDIGSYQPVRLLFSPSGDYKFQVFIHRTLSDGKIDLEDTVAVERVIETLRVQSGFVMCPGIGDYDAIFSDIRIQLSNVREELWPWRHVSAAKCKLWHKPRGQLELTEDSSLGMRDVCAECKLVRRQMLVVRDKRKSLNETDREERQQASSKIRLSFLSPESQKARHSNVRRERKNFRRIAERMIRRTSMTVNQDQNSELVKLINCIESSKEGQEDLANVFEEADKHKSGSGAILREMWQMEKEAFFKDQQRNGELNHLVIFKYNHFRKGYLCGNLLNTHGQHLLFNGLCKVSGGFTCTSVFKFDLTL